MTLNQVEREQREAEESAKKAVRQLFESKKPALLLLTWTRETHTLVEFPNEAVFETAALSSGYRLAKVVRAVLGSYDHYLFLTKVNGLSEAQLLDCRV